MVWNEASRLGSLLRHLRNYFEHIAVVVQQSSDLTLAVAEELATQVYVDAHRGTGDASFGPILLPRIKTKWTLKVDADEWPSDLLLSTLSYATWIAEHSEPTHDAVWVPFRSQVENMEYTESHGHLRLFHTVLGWPATMHSSPPAQHVLDWRIGHFQHDRSLDEMMRDYLRYYALGRGNSQWEEHNTLMMRSACQSAMERYGEAFVEQYEWWPDVKAIAFKEKS